MQVNSVSKQNFSGGIYASERAHGVLQNAFAEALNSNEISEEDVARLIDKYNRCLNASNHDIRIQYRGDAFCPIGMSSRENGEQLLSKAPELYLCERVRNKAGKRLMSEDCLPGKIVENGDVFISVKDTTTGKVTQFKKTFSVLQADNLIYNLKNALDFVIKRENI